MQSAAGRRIDEAIHARLDKIDFERGTIEVKGKGGKIRTVTVTDRLVLERLDRTRRFPLLRERTARKNVAQLLGHNRTSVTRSYAP